MAEERVYVNPDGSAEYEGGAGEESTMPPVEYAGEDEAFAEEGVAASGTDPAIYLLLVAVAFGILFFVYYRRTKEEEDDFFANLDGEKVGPAEYFLWERAYTAKLNLRCLSSST